MSASEAYISLVKDCLEQLGAISVRRMFGGAGVYADGVMFALIADDTLYLKADETTQAEFEAEGLDPFTYEGRNRTVRMSYWRAPDRLFDTPAECAAWVRTALAVARRSAYSAKSTRRNRRRFKQADANTRA